MISMPILSAITLIGMEASRLNVVPIHEIK